LEKLSYRFPLMKGLAQPFEVIETGGTVRATVVRYYPNTLNVVTEIFMTGFEVTIKAEGEKQYVVKDCLRWTGTEWIILEDDVEVGKLVNRKLLELGDTKELVYKGRTYCYIDQPLETRTWIRDEEENEVALIDHRMLDFSRKKEITLYRDELPVALLVAIDYAAFLKRK